MDVSLSWSGYFVISLLTALSSADNTDCNEIEIRWISHNTYHILNVWSTDNWYNMSFWGGHTQIPSKENIGSDCRHDSGTLVALKDDHPDISTVTDDIVTVPLCGLNENGNCKENIVFEMRKCHGDLLYRFPEQNFNVLDRLNLYICFDRVYSKSNCDDTEKIYQHEIGTKRIINVEYWDAVYGWLNGFINGKQFVPQSKEDKDEAFSECLGFQEGFFLRETFPNVVSETPVRLPMCQDYKTYDGTCTDMYFMYARRCNGHLQFDISFIADYGCDNCLCFVHHGNVKVKPESGHEILNTEVNGKFRKAYRPFLQYKCEFEMIDGETYITKWYVNGTFKVQMGPSSNQDEFLYKEDSLSALGPGYEVQCGVITVDRNESLEVFSDIFYAGFKIKGGAITLSKSGSATVDIEQTIPVGCYYTDDEEPNCEERITFEDESSVSDMCAGKLRVQNNADVGNSFVKIKALVGLGYLLMTYFHGLLSSTGINVKNATRCN